MSRIGNQPIPVPSGVDIDIKSNDVTVKGPKGTLTRTFHEDMSISRENGTVLVARPSDTGEHKALHGLTRSLLNNMVVGVSDGFSRTLDLMGVGYRVAQSGPGISLSVMLSHTVDIAAAAQRVYRQRNPLCRRSSPYQTRQERQESLKDGETPNHKGQKGHSPQKSAA